MQHTLFELISMKFLRRFFSVINSLFLSIKLNLRRLLKTFLIQQTINHDMMDFFNGMN